MFDTMIDDMDILDNDIFGDEEDIVTDDELASDEEIENLILNDNPYAHMEEEFYF